MKKIHLIILFIMVLVMFSGCFGGKKNEVAVGTTTEVQPTAQVTGSIEIAENESVESTRISEVERNELLPLPDELTEFAFSSGAGAWSTIIWVSPDGSFSGEYHDAEMGGRDVDYPNGTMYTCSFRGCFGNIEKINDYSYKMTLSDIDMFETPGEEWIEDGTKYIASSPYGIEGGYEFILYLPETPVDVVDEYFLSWWPGRYDHYDNPKKNLDYYGILNVNTGEGFFAE